MNLPPNPFLQLVPARIPQAIARLRSALWSGAGEPAAISATDPSPEHRPFAAARKLPFKPVRGPHHYGKLWDQRWFAITLPRITKPFYLRWNDEAEATLYLDGKPHYGLDAAHPCAPIPAGTRTAHVESVVCRTGIWTPAATGLSPEGSRWLGAELLFRDDLVWSVLHDFLVLEDLMREELRAAFPGREGEFGAIGVKPHLGAVPPLLRILLRHLDEALDALDAGGPARAKKALAAAFQALRGADGPPRAVLTGHAHIDLVWLWPERVGEFKAVHTFATANRLMELYPEYRFAYSQPASYEAVARISPAMDAAVRARIKSGAWEAHGATYVESDTLLACGEALVRSFILGQKGFEALGAGRSPILWLPDVFGYSGCLPQMMKETGADFFFTTKLAWNAITPFPYSSFRWIGADGSEVLAHICHTTGGYNQAVGVNQLRAGAAAHRNCDVHPEFLAPTGFGDGGGGTTEEMCERARRCASLRGVPAASWGALRAFFENMRPLRDRLPEYRGELYFEYHRGTYTTHGNVKAALRAAERALQAEEAAACAAGRGPVSEKDWKRVVFAQFHDYIPGSSIHEVYDEALAELGAITKAASERCAAALGRKGAEAIFNPLPQPRVVIENNRVLSLPPLAGLPLSDCEPLDATAVTAEPARLSNSRVDARFDAFGRLTRLVVDGEPVRLAAPANEFVLYPEHPHMFDAWDIDRQALSLGVTDKRRAAARAAGHGTFQGAVVFDRPLGSASSVTVRYLLDAESPVLRVEYDLDWREERTLLKAVFPTEYLGRDARFAAPYGSVCRAQLGGDTQAEAKWEMPASRWVIVSDDSESEGLFVVTEAKFGFSCRAGALAPSLVRSAKITSEERGRARGSHPETIRRTLSPSVVSDIGRHHIAMAVGRFDPGAPREEHPAALAESLFAPVIRYNGGPVSAGFLGLDGGPSLQPAWAMPEGAGAWVLRLHETLGRAGTIRPRLAPGFTARQVDLSGNPLGKTAAEFAFRPYQIVSLRIERA